MASHFTSSNSNSLPNANANASVASTSSSSSVVVIEWQWRTHDLLWRSFDNDFTCEVEAASKSGMTPVQIGADLFYHFQPQTLKQVNLTTQRERSVRRHSGSQTNIWEWWDAERKLWHTYDNQLTSKFETAWLDSIHSRTSNQPDGSAGIFFELSGRHYCMLFEADAIEYNIRTKIYRIVRRRTYLLNHPGFVASTAMGGCNSCSASTVSQIQVAKEESKLLKSSDSEYTYLIDCPNPKDGENCSICLSSLQDEEAVELDKCHHIFHRECLITWLKGRPTCPACLTVYGVITGTQPPGKMSIRYIPITSKEAGSGLDGYPNTDIIEITYMFRDGIQTAEHPSPGNPYSGTRRIAYLPRNKEGEEILELLKIAWDRRLLFKVGTSVTTGRSNTVVWAGIHHKTQKRGGSTNWGYPDERYFDRVKAELANFNVKSDLLD
ncbi:hypothetical protein SUGI_1026110 [Cryptomeria japonica]|uniref:uncharacterized protein LOC131040861 n=1 Tax=Cryptomeria japonica TaxID=3369 RepID=UPI002414A33D|nr:uncharacterized protein LOC131040861 [Cryptomeria japonica]GLJ48638.1 hypothetical protein SUGI_1026110 [Cryptomeria japonica]